MYRESGAEWEERKIKKKRKLEENEGTFKENEIVKSGKRSTKLIAWGGGGRERGKVGRREEA